MADSAVTFSATWNHSHRQILEALPSTIGSASHMQASLFASPPLSTRCSRPEGWLAMFPRRPSRSAFIIWCLQK